MSKTALLLVDYQQEYSADGKWPQSEIESAVANGTKLLNHFREQGKPIIHVYHVSESNDAPVFVPDSDGIKFHSAVAPLEGEFRVMKHNINSFRDTDLKKILDDNKIDSLIIVGATSHLCIDAVTRAATDFGYHCTVIHDACATSDLEFNGIKVQAIHVQACFMSALGFMYATVTSTDSFLSKFDSIV